MHLGARIGVIQSGLFCVGCLTCGAVNSREALTHKSSSIQKHVTQPSKVRCDDRVVADLESTLSSQTLLGLGSIVEAFKKSLFLAVMFWSGGGDRRPDGWFLFMVGSICDVFNVADVVRIVERQKGIRWMPWHQEAMKDVARCEKPWGEASTL